MECTLHIATSLDGYISDPDGGIAWLETLSSDPGVMARVLGFIAGCDTLVIGRITYEQLLGFGEWPYADKRTLVVSETLPAPLSPNTEIVAKEQILDRLQAVGAQKVWVVGGGQVNSYMCDRGWIDRMFLTVAPIVIGAGRALFPGLAAHARMRLAGMTQLPDDFVELEYVFVKGEG
jgi:dihydrofolate reductase